MRLLQVKICTDVVINHTCVCWAEGRGSTRPAARTSMPPVRSSHLWYTLPLTSMMTNAPAAVEILRIAKTFIRYNFKSDKRGLVGNAIGHRWKLEYFYPLGKAIKSIWISDGLRMTHHNILHTTGQKISSCYWKTLCLPSLHLIIKNTVKIIQLWKISLLVFYLNILKYNLFL